MSNSSPEITIRNCIFAFKCSADWDDLDETEDDSVKFCQGCQREVHFCDTDEQLVLAVKRNKCVAIPSPYKASLLIGDVIYSKPEK